MAPHLTYVHAVSFGLHLEVCSIKYSILAVQNIELEDITYHRMESGISRMLFVIGGFCTVDIKPKETYNEYKGNLWFAYPNKLL